MKLFVKNLPPKILVVVLFSLGYIISHITKIGCIWKYLFKIPCPGCGFTRAMTAALHFNFAEAFRLHPMFWTFPVILVYFLFGDNVLKSKKFDYLMLAILFGFAVAWVFRLYRL